MRAVVQDGECGCPEAPTLPLSHVTSPVPVAHRLPASAVATQRIKYQTAPTIIGDSLKFLCSWEAARGKAE